jgi:malate dehydrogenase (oxaloacetate-decarboxylating)(NADP+)
MTVAEVLPLGIEMLRNPALNKGTAFTEAERDRLGLHGLLPPRVSTPEEQTARVLENLRRKTSPIEKYIFLSSLQARNETLFQRVLQENLEELMPIVYTPTVGEACQTFGHIYRNPKGLYLSRFDRGRIERVLSSWPHQNIGVIVVTDGERILGLGDQGANGMGIPVGKLALYTACAGIPPSRCLPITIDTGTENEALLTDPLYLGVKERRLRGADYASLVEELATAVAKVFPRAILQLEDFATENAFALLSRYRDRMPAFDDDIQGTAAVAVAGIISALRLTHGTLEDQRLLFLGAGEAGTGIADLFVAMLVQRGMPQAAARGRCWFVDSKGLVVASREGLAAHKKPYAHEQKAARTLLEAIELLRPTALIGVSGAVNAFNGPVLEAMAKHNQRPIVFALSNPTSKAECTAEEAYRLTTGRAVFASGSPFPEVTLSGRQFVPGQCNNAYIFPGVGLGVLGSGARRVTNEMFAAAAQALAELVTSADLEMGRIFPSLTRIREVSLHIAEAVAEVTYRENLTDQRRPAALREHLAAQMYQPIYPDYAN